MAFNIYYDGDCYFCSHFVKKLELEETYGQVNLYSIRDDFAVKEKIKTLGFNVNKGFLVEYNQKWFWGDEAYKLVNINKMTRTPGPRPPQTLPRNPDAL